MQTFTDSNTTVDALIVCDECHCYCHKEKSVCIDRVHFICESCLMQYSLDELDHGE